MHGVDLDKCEMPTRSVIKATLNILTLGLGLRIIKTRQTYFYRSMLSYNFIVLKRAITFCCSTLVDPFPVNCIVLDKDTTHYFTRNFHNIYGIY